MDNNQLRYESLSRPSPAIFNENNQSQFISKNKIIIILGVLLILSFLGINIFDVVSNIIKAIISILGPIVGQLLAVFGYTSGTLINKGADVVSDTAKVGIDIAEGTIQNIGNILISASSGNVPTNFGNVPTNFGNVPTNLAQINPLDIKLNQDKQISKPKQPTEDTTENPIQNPISASKSGWCLIGEYENRRGCIEVGEQDKCLSGQIFPNQKMCLNPTMTANINTK
jgi:hypothetical protein